jgi:hypothetical protein
MLGLHMQNTQTLWNLKRNAMIKIAFSIMEIQNSIIKRKKKQEKF